MKRFVVLFAIPVLFACGGEQYTTVPAAGPAAGAVAGAYTGILVNAQRPASETPLSVFEVWQVVNEGGEILFTNADAGNHPTKGIAWEWKIAKTRELSATNWLGRNPYTVRVVRTEVAEDQKSCRFVVDDVTTAEFRAIPNSRELLKKDNLMILVGKIGE
jgi:hypothetical protein